MTTQRLPSFPSEELGGALADRGVLVDFGLLNSGDRLAFDVHCQARDDDLGEVAGF